ncbi:hypothetical protein [Microbacterium flavescens]|uniref:hypothetical protein n=1 Tax=Microbacterium flavescens TaxID=69366 RepID=UPI001BDF53A9|nr:hypothetical protein [Microbacterium flavescens]BFF09220.1 hypothetical protein GCM10025699_05230 [Microbacterium flavescens]
MFGKKKDDESPGLDDLARAVLIEEHSSLRAEILASYGYAQSIVKWTLATFAAVIAAGLVAINNSTGSASNTILVNVVLVIFAFGLPGIIWLNASTWLGELYRAERAGSYLRAMEANLAGVEGLTARLGFQAARWETFIWSNRKARGLWGKQLMTYVGTAGTFFGTAVGSFVILCIVISDLLGRGLIAAPGASWLWIVGSVLINLLCIGFCFAIYRRLMALGDMIAPVEDAY